MEVRTVVGQLTDNLWFSPDGDHDIGIDPNDGSPKRPRDVYIKGLLRTQTGTGVSGVGHQQYETSGRRWVSGLLGTESGSNVGADLALWSYNDSGVFIRTHMRLLQRRVVEMSRPIYLINAPLNYGYHIAIGHDERNRLYRSVLRLLDSLRSNIHEAHLFQPSEIRELLSPVHIDDSIFKDAGMLRFDEINDARAVHFGKFKTTFVEFCEGAVDTLDLEEAYRSYQSNLKGHLTRRNARFDMIVAKSARTLATTSAYVGKIAPPFAAAATGFQVPESYYVQVTLGLLAQLLQRGLEAFAGAKEARANLVGTRKLLTRLQAWTHTEGIDRNASWQDHSPN